MLGLNSMLGLNNKSWSLYCLDGYYVAHYNGSITNIQWKEHHRVAVGRKLAYIEREDRKLQSLQGKRSSRLCSDLDL